MDSRHEDSDDESYVRVGNAFKILETDEDIVKAKEKKAKESYVLDKQGRRRFHGAFTGGFSAGYFNTVGTKEGWSPASFTSSRSTKGQSKRQRPEDFMDEEDLDVFGIAPREISTRDPFKREDEEMTAARGASSAASALSVIPGVPPLQDLIVPSRSTVGARLLKAMGWREGQGVGPKVQRPTEVQLLADNEKMYGCSLPPPPAAAAGNDNTSDSGYLFAPHDVAPWQHECKDNRHGIGYKGMLEQNVLSTSAYSKSLYGMSGQAFGVGALEEDDEDIYSQESLTSYSHTLSSERELDSSQKFGWTGSSSESWSLDMFVKVVKQVGAFKKYPAPYLPSNYVPVHVFSSTAPEVSHLPLSACQRQHLVNEAAGSSGRSVFDYVSSSDKQRIHRLANQSKGKAQEPIKKSPVQKPIIAPQPVTRDTAPLSSLGQTLLTGDYQPFADNPSKQLRYESYLSGRRKFTDRESSNFTEWEKQKELDEFSRKARLLQPLSMALSDKFTHAVSSTAAAIDNEQNDNSKQNEEAIEAAKIGMFGVMTREQEEWHPHRVLCKRFNVPNPYPNSEFVGVPVADVPTKVVHFESSSNSSRVEVQIPESQVIKEFAEELQEEQVFQEGSNAEIQEEVMELDMDKEIFSNPRPAMSTFVSIFADNSNEEDKEENMTTEEQPLPQQKTWQNLASLVSLPSSTLATLANPVAITDQKQTRKETEKVKKLQETQEFFGPSLPPNLEVEEEEEKRIQDKHRHHHHKRSSSSHHKKAKHKRKHSTH